MHAPIHLALSWLIGSRLPARRDRVLVTWAGVIPDVDAISRFWGVEAYVRYHHVIAHGIIAAIAVALLCAAAARERFKTIVLAILAFHVHLVCDLIGSGAQGQPWSIAYFWPFSRREFWVAYGWDLASPENAFVWLGAVALTIVTAVRYGRTFGEAFLPERGDAAVAATLRRMFQHSSAAKSQAAG